METPLSSNTSQLTDIRGRRAIGIFLKDKELSVPTLRNWTNLRCTPHYRVGHFVYCDVVEVAIQIRTKLKVPARGQISVASQVHAASTRAVQRVV